MSCLFCFFFQAEDGIRDLTVTGVQTCALPISVGREEEVGDAHGLEHTSAHGARPREQRRVELGAPERQIERLVPFGEERESGGEGKRGGLGGGRLNKKKKKQTIIHNVRTKHRT